MTRAKTPRAKTPRASEPRAEELEAAAERIGSLEEQLAALREHSALQAQNTLVLHQQVRPSRQRAGPWVVRDSSQSTADSHVSAALAPGIFILLLALKQTYKHPKHSLKRPTKPRRVEDGEVSKSALHIHGTLLCCIKTWLM